MKKLIMMAVSAAVALCLSVPAFAGAWEGSNEAGWKWKKDDGEYSTNCWEWIDGDNDGTAECYHFSKSGFLDVNTTTQDNFQVNEEGQWVLDGQIQFIHVNDNPEQPYTASSYSQLPDYGGDWSVIQGSWTSVARFEREKFVQYITGEWNVVVQGDSATISNKNGTIQEKITDMTDMANYWNTAFPFLDLPLFIGLCGDYYVYMHDRDVMILGISQNESISFKRK